MKFCFGPMSKNVVDTIIKYSIGNNSNDIVFIPSRRQIEHNGGYSNNWNTKEFVEYVKKNNKKILIERDHAGPGQGLYDDDGFVSLKEDALYMDIIHIDPWKKYSEITQGIEWTVNMINYCYDINPNLYYEIGTEENIRPFTVEELEYIIVNLKNMLKPEIFEKIKYLVIQCGTKLLEKSNIGLFDEYKLKQMIELSQKYNMIAKEHNGDWVELSLIKNKEKLGLTCINIAPELGEIESKVILNNVKNNIEDYEKIYNLCIESGKWKKWVSNDFDYINRKDDIILICCHYIFNEPSFIEIKNKYLEIDSEIQKTIYDKLLDLYDIYKIRSKCIFCDNDKLDLFFENDYNTSLSLAMYKNVNENGYFMPYNIQLCKNCSSLQNKYIGNLELVYNVNHVDDYGITKNKKHTLLSDFILENKNINGIVEVGSCNGVLAENILQTLNNTHYTIIEPSFTGNRTNLNIIEDYFENVNLLDIKSNTIIMSDVFEHFYNPRSILEQIQKQSNIQYIYLSHPDFDYSIKNNILTNLNSEHTFLIKHNFLFALFENYGFKLKRRYDFYNFSLFLEFEKKMDIILTKPLINNNLEYDGKQYFNNLISIVKNINKFIQLNSTKQFYIWPCSIHSVTLLNLGLEYKNICGILDNSPNKIGKYLYGYNLLCSSFNDTLNIKDENIIVIISGAGSYIKELDLQNTLVTIKFLEDFS